MNQSVTLGVVVVVSVEVVGRGCCVASGCEALGDGPTEGSNVGVGRAEWGLPMSLRPGEAWSETSERVEAVGMPDVGEKVVLGVEAERPPVGSDSGGVGS